MDKTGEIRKGVTPPEPPRLGEKQAANQDLASHTVNRLADAAAQAQKNKAEKR